MTTKVSSMLFQWYDQRPQRERVVLLVCAVVVLIFLVNFLALQPFFEQRVAAQKEVVELKASLAELNAQEAAIKSRKESDPDQENRLRLEVLKGESRKLQQQLRANIVNLVSPQEMQELLKDLLTQQKQLQLISLKNLAPELLKLDQKAGEDIVTPTLYRHRLWMEFSGDYLTMLQYLRQLEQLPRAVVWEEVEIETQKYPETRVRLQVYTLSLTEGWIGG
ncbi:MAG: type II secretion system protein GspM [Thermodesulfobacteriota bacterium]|nr:type II secretion system protein GspM [Thermodesulfobacteriota bacterium]